ncbi:MAG: hypothetical protein HYY18_21995 [Planctomycetes bacterium]|nr:hypothetical protein [Planctomycetota bacterium]
MRRTMLMALALSAAAVLLAEPGNMKGWDQTGRRDPFRNPMTPLPVPGAGESAEAGKSAEQDPAGPATNAARPAPPLPSATVCCYESRDFRIDLGLDLLGRRMSSGISLALPVSESVALFGETWCSRGDAVPGRPDLVIQDIQDGRVLTRDRN